MKNLYEILVEKTDDGKYRNVQPLNKLRKVRINLDKLDETSNSRLFTYHSLNGYIIISAYYKKPNSDIFGGDYEKWLAYAEKKTKELYSDVVSSGYTYLPVRGGWDYDDKKGNVTKILETSFILFNHKKSSKSGGGQGMKDLFQLGKDWANKYKQDSFLFVPNTNSVNSKNKEFSRNTKLNAYYILPNGKVDFKFNALRPANVLDEYFTVLSKSRGGVENNRQSFAYDFKESFSYRKGIIYFALSPESFQESAKRSREYFPSMILNEDDCISRWNEIDW